MDLQWKAARMRRWIEFGERENLSFGELAKQAGVHPRTLRRWSRALRERTANDQASGFGELACNPHDPSSVGAARSALPEGAFVDLEESAPGPAGRIEIALRGDRRIIVEGAVDVEGLVSVIKAVEQC